MAERGLLVLVLVVATRVVTPLLFCKRQWWQGLHGGNGGDCTKMAVAMAVVAAVAAVTICVHHASSGDKAIVVLQLQPSTLALRGGVECDNEQHG